jgi:hypothetical protein
MKHMTLPLAACGLLLGLAAVFGQAAGPEGNTDLSVPVQVHGESLRMLDGELRAALALFKENLPGSEATDAGTDPESQEDLDMEALERGSPGGIVVDEHFSLILVDGRVLARLRAAQVGRINRIRVSGLLHDDCQSITPLRIEYLSGGRWIVFDLPISGTLGPSVLRGDQ